MQKHVFKIMMLLMVVAALVMTSACSKKQTDATAPETPVVTSTDQGTEETPAVDEDALRADAERRAMEEARNSFIADDVLFDFDSSNLNAVAQEKLRSKAMWLRNNSDVTVAVEGHCDERGTAEYNLALGDRRAQSAKAFLVDLGIAPSRLTTISYGEEMPVDPGHAEDAWVKNRRAHFSIK